MFQKCQKIALITLLLSFCGTDNPNPHIVIFGGSTAVGANKHHEYDFHISFFENGSFGQYNPDKIGVEIGISQVIGNINLVKYAVGATSLSCEIREDCWNGGYLLEDLESLITQAQEKDFKVSHYIWLHGKIDAQVLNDAMNYEKNFIEMKTRLEGKFGKAKWIVGLPRLHVYDNTSIVREALKKVSDCYVDLDNYQSVDGTHLYEDEYVKMGQEMAKCL